MYLFGLTSRNNRGRGPRKDIVEKPVNVIDRTNLVRSQSQEGRATNKSISVRSCVIFGGVVV